MNFIPRHLPKHARARLIAWTLAMLAWLAWAMSGAAAPKRRHIRRRYRFISLDRLARTTAMLIISRAGDLARKRFGRRNPFFNRVRGRARWPRHVMRSLIGGRLRRALKHESFTTRVAILADALRRIDAWAAPLVKRVRRGMTKLWPRRTAPGAPAPVVALAVPPAFFADTG
jgi:hypothetical protein